MNGLQNCTYRDRKASRHAVEVVGVSAHGDDLGYDGFIGPLDTENLGQFLQVLGTGFTDAEDGVA